jgi:hypothetical protein
MCIRTRRCDLAIFIRSHLLYETKRGTAPQPLTKAQTPLGLRSAVLMGRNDWDAVINHSDLHALTPSIYYGQGSKDRCATSRAAFPACCRQEPPGTAGTRTPGLRPLLRFISSPAGSASTGGLRRPSRSSAWPEQALPGQSSSAFHPLSCISPARTAKGRANAKDFQSNLRLKFDVYFLSEASSGR